MSEDAAFSLIVQRLGEIHADVSRIHTRIDEVQEKNEAAIEKVSKRVEAVEQTLSTGKAKLLGITIGFGAAGGTAPLWIGKVYRSIFGG
jgi:histidine ammonia-lyase